MVLVNTLGGQSTPGASPGTQVLPLELEIARGAVPGVSTHVVRGHIVSAAAAAGFKDVWEPNTADTGDLVYITSATTIEIDSTSTNDTSDGTGLRTLLLQGIAALGSAQQEVITMNGTTEVLTANQYLRGNSMVGLTAGSVGWNVGNVIASAADDGIQCEMDATESISQNSHYTVPLGKTFHVTQLEFNTAKAAAGQDAKVEFKVYVRSGGDGKAWLQLFDKVLDTADATELDVNLPFPSSDAQAVERTDFRIRIDTDKDNTQARTRMYGYLIDNA